jgi:hypothetical protein
MLRTFILLLLAAMSWNGCGLAYAAEPTVTELATAEVAIEYNRDIRPILVENCFACHGADSAARKADLRLDKRETAEEMGAITPGDVGSSSLVERIESTDPEMMMPPHATKKQLTAEQKDLLKRWIASGAEYEPHWSFIAPVKAELPAVKNQAWVRNPIDQFVLARLEAMGLRRLPRRIARR